VFYRLPQDHPRISESEKQLILADAKNEDVSAGSVPIGQLLRMKEAWGCILARVLTDPISYFLFFWTPKYLQQERGFNLADLGKFGWIPFAALALGNLASGGIPRLLISRGWSVNRARKTTMLSVSCAMPIFCYWITQTGTPSLALGVMALIMFCHSAWGNITLPAEVFPKRAVGSVSGFGGALGGFVGAITQLTIGWVVQNLSFTPIFAVCSVMYLIAFALVHFLIGELGSIRRISPATAEASSSS
jgi:ACS family hexuronate transporter-like MFS transporter